MRTRLRAPLICLIATCVLAAQAAAATLSPGLTARLATAASSDPVGIVIVAFHGGGPLNAQHLHMHFGTAGVNLFERAGHVVVPGAPFPEPFFEAVPWSNCEELIAFFFGG